ncbi:substrate-binding domain-containing protein [Lentilitoribacter sp. EG35]|uniref:LacI family DNA-binding transcriptional regulator n=1 Tax=Lentilitoribacter sp. EG35 TaxID=3234192 RepID=UPI0034610E73
MRARSRKGAPGIIEVAKRSGVSPATVSRFFNEPEIVKGKTRKLIEQAAKDLGYYKTRMEGGVHHGFSGTIGLIVPTIDNAIFAELIQAFSSRLLTHDRTMLIAAHGYNPSLEVGIVKSLLDRRIDGVALIGVEHEKAPLEMLAARGVPVLAAWNYRKNSSIPCVGADNFEVGYRAAKHLTKMGHHDIALVFPPTKANDRAEDRLNGVMSALGISPDELAHHRFIQTRYDIGEAKRAIMEILMKERPSAIICGNDVIAQGAVYACQSINIAIPDDISIIGIGDFRGSSHMEPSLTTVRMPAQRIAETAADLLCGGLSVTSKSGITRIKIESELMVRESVRDISMNY